MNSSDARYALVRDRLRRIGKDIAFLVTDGDLSQVQILDERTGNVAVYHGHPFDSLTVALDTVERLTSGYEAGE